MTGVDPGWKVPPELPGREGTSWRDFDGKLRSYVATIGMETAPGVSTSPYPALPE
jgi:hypothetical protein